LPKTIPALPVPVPPPLTWRQRLGQIVGLSELLVVVGLALWVVAFWTTAREAALGVPAAILVWYGLPPRPWFISDHERKG